MPYQQYVTTLFALDCELVVQGSCSNPLWRLDALGRCAGDARHDRAAADGAHQLPAPPDHEPPPHPVPGRLPGPRQPRPLAALQGAPLPSTTANNQAGRSISWPNLPKVVGFGHGFCISSPAHASNQQRYRVAVMVWFPLSCHASKSPFPTCGHPVNGADAKAASAHSKTWLGAGGI